MVTGDHAFTAAAIARETGLLGPTETVLQGPDLPEDDAVLAALLDRDGVVVSRVTPEQKLRVARLLQGRGHVLAMTGDGVNDGPALQQADIGVAMGLSGTDVAREAADLVLLDDDFATIIAAVEQGRATYANIRRFLTYHLTDNVAELTPFVIWALSGGHFPLALGVLQILALDIGTDLLPALALGSEAPSKGTLKRPPERRHLMDRALMFRVFGLLGPVEAADGDDGVHGGAARRGMAARRGTAGYATCSWRRPARPSPRLSWPSWRTPSPAAAPPSRPGGWAGSPTGCCCGPCWPSWGCCACSCSSGRWRRCWAKPRRRREGWRWRWPPSPPSCSPTGCTRSSATAGPVPAGGAGPRGGAGPGGSPSGGTGAGGGTRVQSP